MTYPPGAAAAPVFRTTQLMINADDGLNEASILTVAISRSDFGPGGGGGGGGLSVAWPVKRSMPVFVILP